jgi:hypothetical protein
MSSGASITILAWNEGENQALLDWSRGLDWVRWLVSGVRSQLPSLMAAPPSAPVTGAAILDSWADFSENHFLPHLAPFLRECWHHASAGRTRSLIVQAQLLDHHLQTRAREHSQAAAHLLLRATRGAQYQGLLGKHRAAIADGRCPAHFIPVWAAIADLFQLGLANTCAEYLRLEWAILSRHTQDLEEPAGAHSIIQLTRHVLGSSPFALNAPPDQPLFNQKEG